MKVLQINSVSGIRSTGRICTDIAGLLEKNGDECLILYGREHAGEKGKDISLRIGNKFTNILHYISYMLHDDDGKGSRLLTKYAIRQIQKYKPDVIHLHNIHDHYINFNVLMNFLSESQIPVVITLHDCWYFTGNCTHFDYCGCQKWKTCCGHCPRQDKYPLDRYWLDCSEKSFLNKKEKLSKVKKKVIVPVSYWLEGLVKQSFLKNDKIETIQAGLELSKYYPVKSDIKKRYHLEKRHIVVCVASQWTFYKGSHYLKYAADCLRDTATLVVIGSARDSKEVLNTNIIHIDQTHDVEELLKWYTAADVFLNLTLQESLGLTNIEALACGTPVVSFDSGGCRECVDETCGILVPRDDIERAIEAVKYVISEHPFSAEACIGKSKEFDKFALYNHYLSIYKELTENNE